MNSKRQLDGFVFFLPSCSLMMNGCGWSHRSILSLAPCLCLFWFCTLHNKNMISHFCAVFGVKAMVPVITSTSTCQSTPWWNLTQYFSLCSSMSNMSPRQKQVNSKMTPHSFGSSSITSKHIHKYTVPLHLLQIFFFSSDNCRASLKQSDSAVLLCASKPWTPRF